MHSLRSGGAVSRAFAGDYLSTTMQRVFWEKIRTAWIRTAWRYMLLAEIVSPGPEGDTMVEGLLEGQYRRSTNSSGRTESFVVSVREQPAVALMRRFGSKSHHSWGHNNPGGGSVG